MIGRLNHVAIAVRDIAAASRVYRDTLGAEVSAAVPQPGWSEQAPADWWSGSQEAIAALGPLEIAGIGLSGQMHGLVALDEAERVLRPAILWNDQRTAAECAEIEARVGLDRLIALTGNRALTGFRRCHAADSSSISKMLPSPATVAGTLA